MFAFRFSFIRMGCLGGALVSLIALANPVAAVRQVTPVTVDGSVRDIDGLDSTSQVPVAHSTESMDGDLLHLRLSNDDQLLYLGLACRLPRVPGSLGLIVFFDGQTTGTSTLRTQNLTGPSALLRSLDGTVLEQGFSADHALTVEPVAGGYQATLTDLVGSHTVDLGRFDFGSPGPVRLKAGDRFAGEIQLAFDPGETTTVSQSPEAFRGLEVAIPLGLVAEASRIPTATSPADTPVHVFAASVSVVAPFWTNHTLPPSVTAGDTKALGGIPGAQPNFAENRRGGFPTTSGQGTGGNGPGMVGYQALSAALPATVIVFHLE